MSVGEFYSGCAELEGREVMWTKLVLPDDFEPGNPLKPLPEGTKTINEYVFSDEQGGQVIEFLKTASSTMPLCLEDKLKGLANDDMPDTPTVELSPDAIEILRYEEQIRLMRVYGLHELYP